MSKKSFVKGAIILGLAGLTVQILGAVFRIPLANIIGDKGMGYFSTAYPIYIFLLVFSTAGIPAAISKLVSEKSAVGNRLGAHRVFKISFVLMFAIGITTSAILFFGAKYLVYNVFRNPGAYLSMVTIAPALLLVPVMAAFRGYFQGLQDMKPTAISQIVEQIFRVPIGLFLAFFLVSKGLEYAAAGATSGAAFGTIAGTLILMVIYFNRRKGIRKEIRESVSADNESSRRILYKILSISIPITIGAAVLPIMNLIDVSIVMRRLQDTGFTPEAANALWGQLSGMAGPIINIPQALTMSIAMSLVPTISGAFGRKDFSFLQYNVQMGLRVSMIIGLPCAFGLMTLSQQIMLLIYPMQKASAMNASTSLFILAFGVIFLSVVQTFAGILQGLGRPFIPVVNLLSGVLVKAVLTYILTGIPSLNVQGAAIGTSAAYIVVSVLNFIAVKKYTHTHFDIGLTFIKPLISGIVMSICVFGFYEIGHSFISQNLSTAISVLVGGASYVITLILFKAITAEDMKMMPKGDKLIKILEKLKLMPR